MNNEKIDELKSNLADDIATMIDNFATATGRSVSRIEINCIDVTCLSDSVRDYRVGTVNIELNQPL